MSKKTLNFYELRQANAARGVEWCGKQTDIDDLEFCTIELGGEVGEVLDAVKKLARQKKGYRGGVHIDDARVNIAAELADVVICADRLAEALKIDLGTAVRRKFNATSKRYGLEVTL